MTQPKQIINPYAEKQRLTFQKRVGKLLGYRRRYEKHSDPEAQARFGHQAEVSIWIDRPPQEVFRFIANYHNDTRWRRGVTKMTQSPAGETGVGTTTHEEMDFLGRRYVTLAKVTAFEPDRRLAWASIEATTPVSGWRMVEIEGRGTRFSQVITADLRGFYRWLSPVMVSALKKQMGRDVANLKSILEHDAAQAA